MPFLPFKEKLYGRSGVSGNTSPPPPFCIMPPAWAWETAPACRSRRRPEVGRRGGGKAPCRRRCPQAAGPANHGPPLAHPGGAAACPQTRGSRAAATGLQAGADGSGLEGGWGHVVRWKERGGRTDGRTDGGSCRRAYGARRHACASIEPQLMPYPLTEQAN